MLEPKRLAGWLLIGLLGGAAVAQSGRSTIRSSAPTSTVALLAQRVDEVAFEEAPLDRVIEWISRTTRTNILVRWSVLEDYGIGRDKSISIHIKNSSLARVLWLIMNEAGGAEVKLAYRATGDLIIFSTQDDLEDETVVRVYDVRDLLTRQRSFSNAPRIDLSRQSGGQGASQNPFTGCGSHEGESSEGGVEQAAQQVRALIEVIVETIEPDSWAINGGQGSIAGFGRQLVVRNNLMVHQALGGPVSDAD